ncbi:hypothetical protein L484_010950 [Morus notabilis]|uniref:Uncharacterized protein n=1 Tax=Morus notabilis TaxID=981085 RepID=W9RZS2_9ROSA|nr:hypothetical protein L484_010950 [Morus notabilis]
MKLLSKNKKQGSISFRSLEKEGSSSRGNFVELSLFSPGRDATPPGSGRFKYKVYAPTEVKGWLRHCSQEGSPPLLDGPMRPPAPCHGT